RTHGRFDHAYPLSIEAIALSWPLPGGRLLLPGLVSDAEHAPLMGEAAIFHQLTHQPVSSNRSSHSGTLPGIVFVCLAFYLLPGGFLLRISYRLFFRRAGRNH
ncbi:MAG TPA: hypothetical protein VF593_11900, partial [Chthoniobacteraceae bacterium]